MKFRTILLGLAALFVSLNAAFFSVTGLSSLFAGATVSVIVMASSLEIAKLVGASYLYNYWDTTGKLIRTYLISAIVFLVLLTSIGIYGYLTSAYQTTSDQLNISEKQIELIDAKKSRYEIRLTEYNSEKSQLTETINELSKGLANNVIQYKDKETGEIITTTSSSTRRALQSELDDSKERRSTLNEKIDVANDSITSFEIQSLNLKVEDETAGELGPLKFIATVTGLEMSTVVNWLTLIIIIVFDPLAVILIVSFNNALKVDKGEKDKKRAMKTLEVYGEKEEREKHLQQMVKDAEDMNLYDDSILKSERDKEIFFNELENPTPPNAALKDAAQKYNDTKLKDIEVIDSEEIKLENKFTPIDEDDDGVVSEEEIRNAYERGGWRNPAPNGAQYYTHPWFDWKKSERWINDKEAVDYWKHYQGGTQKAFELYKNNYPSDFTSKTY